MSNEHVASHYREALALVERLHRRLLDVIKDEFDRRGRDDVNPTQALLLHKLNAAEPTVGELKTLGYYLGANIAANVKMLIAGGFLKQLPARKGERHKRVALTEQGQEIHAIVDQLYAKHVRTVEQMGGVGAEDFEALNLSLVRLERYWTDQIRFRL